MKTKRDMVKVENRKKVIRFEWSNGFSVEFSLQDSWIEGIRKVQCGKINLRNPTRIWKPFFFTPEGIHYTQFQLRRIQTQTDGEVRVVADALGTPIGIKEEQDEYLGDLIHCSLPQKPVADRFEWILAPSSRTVDGRLLTGFSIRYRFQSAAQRALYRLFDHATWEIGGHVEGNTLLFQGQVNPPVTPLKRSLFFTTACNYYGAEMAACVPKPKRVSFQRLPRIGTLQSFDCLVHPRGALIGLFEPLDEIFSLLQKEEGEDWLHVVDEHRRPLSSAFETYPKHILFWPAPINWARENQRNLWADLYDHVHARVRRRYRVRRSPLLPRIWIPQVSTDYFRLDGKDYPREDLFRAFADHRMKTWAEMGAREICIHSIWRSDYTEDRFATKDQTGLHGGLIVGSICCVRIHEVAPLWGGTEGLAYFVEKAHAEKIQVQLWFATHLSARAPILKERPDFMLIARQGLPNGGGFGHQTLVTLDLNNRNCFEWLYDRLVAVHRATDFDGLFHDSYGNMTFLPTHFGDPLRRGQQNAYARLVRALQQAGIRTFTVEGIGPLGVGHFGMQLLLPPEKRTRHYQNALDWWFGQEDMMYGLNMGIGCSPWADRQPTAREFAFRCLAGGGRFNFTAWRPEDHTELWEGWVRELNRIHCRLAPLEGKRRLLPADQGVLWKTPKGRILFAFRPFSLRISGNERLFRIEPEGEQEIPMEQEEWMVEPWSVYRLLP